MKSREAIGISRAAYKLPATRLDVEELERAGRTTSPAAVLRDFGFHYCYLCPPATELSDLVVESGRRVLQQAGSSEGLDRVFLYSALGTEVSGQESAVSDLLRPADTDHSAEGNPLELFRYPAARAHHLLGLGQTPVMGLSQLGCSGLPAMVDMASRLLQTGEKASILCLAGDMLPPGGQREIMYNVMSDAAGALLVERGAARNRIVYFHERVQSYYWDTPEREQELLAAYFPMAQRVISACLRGGPGGLRPEVVRAAQRQPAELANPGEAFVDTHREGLDSQHRPRRPHTFVRPHHQPHRHGGARRIVARRLPGPLHVRFRSKLVLHGVAALAGVGIWLHRGTVERND